jgi:hypothetical protein
MLYLRTKRRLPPIPLETNMTRIRHMTCAAFAAVLGGCATPTVVQSVKPGDNGLSCPQLQNEYADAERLRALADAEKSVTGGNVVRALLFWPAILGTASNANEAIAAADSRKVHLANLMNQKGCAIPIPQPAAPDPAAAPTPNTAATSSQPIAKPPATQPSIQAAPSKEARLTELKRLFDNGLITRDVYVERQKVILDSPTN